MSLDHDGIIVKHQTSTRDAFLGGRLSIAQPAHGFRAGLDSVLLGAAVGRADGTLLDLGAGAGAAALVALSHAPAAWRAAGRERPGSIGPCRGQHRRQRVCEPRRDHSARRDGARRRAAGRWPAGRSLFRRHRQPAILRRWGGDTREGRRPRRGTPHGRAGARPLGPDCRRFSRAGRRGGVHPCGGIARRSPGGVRGALRGHHHPAADAAP